MDQLVRILHLEDDVADAELVQAMLESAGIACQINRVETRDEFEQTLLKGGFDVILADFRLPMFDGMSALRQTLESCPNVPFIFVSRTLGEDSAIDALTQGATDYVLKEKLSRLVPAVRRALHEAEDRRERRRAEESLRESEERFRRLAENAQDVIYRYSLTPTLRLEYVNPAVNKMLGHPPEEFYADPLLFIKILHPDDRQWVEAAMLGGAELEQFSVLRWVHKDGSIVWTEQRHILILDPAGNLLSIEGIARDITERKRAEEALRESRVLFRSLIESLPQNIYSKDTAGRFVFANQRYCMTQGKSLEEIVGKTNADLHPPQLAEKYQRDDRRVMETGRTLEFEEEHQPLGGNRFWVHVIKTPSYDAQGRITGTLGIFWDITERRRAEEQLSLRTTALEAAANAVVITDREGNIQWANPAFTTLTGYTIEEALGKNPRFLKSGQQDQTFYSTLWKTVLAGQVWHGELVNKREDGSLYTEEMTITPVRATGGEVTHFIAIKQDVTQRKQVEAEMLRHVQRLMTLQEIGRAITSTLDLDCVLATLLEQVRQATEAEAGSVALIEAATGELVFRQAVGEAARVMIGLRLKPSQGIAGWAAAHRQTVLASDAGSDPRFYGDATRGTGFVTRDLVAVPLIARDTVVGIIELLNKREGTFSQGDLWLIESVAAQAAVAIENARLFEETHRGLDEMAVVSYVAMVGAAGRPFDETVARATSSLSQLWPGAKVGFLFVNEADQALHPHPSYFGLSPEEIAGLSIPLNQGLTGWAVRERQPVRVCDATSDSRYLLATPDTRSEMVAPLVVGGRVIGVVNVESPRPDIFSGEDLRLLATLASQLATVFEKARLDTELAQHAARLEQRVEERTTEIRHQQARTQAILDALGEGVVVTDVLGTIQYLNPAGQALTGYGAADVIGQNPRLWKSGQVPLSLYQEMWNTILEGRTWRGEIVNRRKDGTLYDVAITVAPIPGEANGGPPAGWVGIQHDITLRKQAEEEIRKALAQEKELGELKSRFISMASHEFRTPLSTILSSSELLEHYGSPWLEGKGLVHLRRIQTAVHNMTELLNDILILGRADAGKLDFNPAPLDVVQFCRDLTEEMQLGVGRQHTLHFVSQKECDKVCLDEKLLRQILSNLLSNACKYSPEGSQVHFDLECREGQVIFCVRDQGIGIPPEDQARMFETFHRARNVNDISGTGLGLAIVKKAVDLHQGTINVASQVEVGTTFTVTLPAAY